MIVIRGIVVGLVGGAAWRLGLQFIFGAAQPLLTDPSHQSSKMLAAFSMSPPMPRMYEQPSIVWVGLLLVGVLWGQCYVALYRHRAGHWWRHGATFGLLAWCLMVPWFEFYLPWNVLREPLQLVALELLCWFVVMQMVGLSMALTDRVLTRWNVMGQSSGSRSEAAPLS